MKNRIQENSSGMNILCVRYARYAIALFFAVALAVSSASATSRSSARSLAMGGAYTALAIGPVAARYNPANLGLTDYRQRGIELFGFGASIQNNAFTLDEYNTYTGAVLSTSDKEYILNQIPNQGLNLKADFEASALSVSKGQFAFNVTAMGAADVNLSRDIFDLLLNGNTFADTIDVTGSYSEAISYVSFGASYGRAIHENHSRQLAVGISLKYLRGLAVERVTELEGLAVTYATGFAGQGSAVIQTAAGGTGYSIDLGVALRLNHSYTLGARLKNALGRISWNNSAQEYSYIFSFDTLTINNINGGSVVSSDTSIDIPSFLTTLPPTLNVGIANTDGKLIWAIDWEQGLRREYGVSTKPKLSVGVEYALVSFFPARAGYSLGGGRNPSLSLGSGLDLSKFYFDFAFVTGSSIAASSSKGLNLSISTGLRF